MITLKFEEGLLADTDVALGPKVLHAYFKATGDFNISNIKLADIFGVSNQTIANWRKCLVDLPELKNRVDNPEKRKVSKELRFSDETYFLCNLLADLIEKNGSKRPTVTESWLLEADRMQRIDHRTVEQIRGAIEWCQQDSFWRANILSMGKLREKYDQLRLKAASQNSLGAVNEYAQRKKLL